LSWSNHSVGEVNCPLAGVHQLDNLHLAVALAVAAEEHGWVQGVSPSLVGAAVVETRWPGRCSSVRIRGRQVLVDVAHNAEAAAALATHLDTLGGTPNLLFSCLEDKPLAAMADVLRPVVGAVAVYPVRDPRAMPLDRLRRAFPEAVVGDDACDALDRLADPVVAAGSVRVVGELMRFAE
jgi:folylpolyglutamate synthase/dihydropteroate synthase